LEGEINASSSILRTVTDFWIDPLRILIVGGYGTFGGRLVELLENEPGLSLIISGRSLEKAHAYCASRTRAAAKLIPASFDRSGSSARELNDLQPDVVVDASGPFQAYGETPYGLVERCLECRVSYLDLADGSDFVNGVARYDEAAKAAGVFVLSGVSSFPVLTAAVVRHFAGGIASIQSIVGGIAPSAFAGVGTNVIRAIASYSGKPIGIRRKGRKEEGRPFVESIRFVVSVPGRIPLEERRFSLVDVPDLAVLPDLWPSVQNVWMGAGPVPLILHRALNLFAWLVKVRLLPSLTWLATPMHFVTEHVRWGEHRGGMFVRVEGCDAQGQPVVREWHLLAEGDDGPLIPCMAIEAVIRKWLSGKRPESGARTAIGDVSLADYESLFKARAISIGARNEVPVQNLPLFQRILGESWPQLAPQIQQLHSTGAGQAFAGNCTLRRGRNILARLIARLSGFPTQGVDMPMLVRIDPLGDGELWVRTCNRHIFSSTQKPGKASSKWLVREQFGPVCVDSALLVEGTHLRYVIRRWALFGISLPLAWGPRARALESTLGDLFKFDVQISHPITGLIVHYTGTLAPMPKK
jgi:hypothetical protein